MTKLTLSDLSNLQNESTVIATINSNNTAIETALEGTLSRDGTSPNTMSADLDMNSNNILNLPYPASDTEPLRLGDIEDLLPTWYSQTTAPAGDIIEGSFWIDSDSTNLDLYRYSSGSWVDTTIDIKGSTGAIGATGSAGTNGTTPGVKYTYSTTTTASDPGDGIFRFNNATIASATALYIDNLDADGNTVTSWLDSLDDSTNTSHYGYLFFRGVTSTSAYAVASITSTVTDSTGYRTIGTISIVASGGTWTNGDTFVLISSRTGNKGADGAGSGDVTGPSSSVDSEIALFSSTTGKVIKRASTTGILKGTSGVISAASAGTDYVAPSGALGTPSSGTLTNCTGLPVAGITASTSTALGVGSVELGHATDTTLSRSSAGVLAVEGVTVSLNSTSATHTAGTIELGAASDTTLSRSSAGILAVEGVTIPRNSTSDTLTIGSIELGNASDTTLSRSSAGVLAVEGKVAATISTVQAWTAQQYVTLDTLTDGANISWDVSTAQKAKVTLGGSRTMNAVTNAVEGGTYTLWVIQDGTGSRTISWTTSGSGSFDFGAAGAPTLTTTASKADVLCFEGMTIGGTTKLRYLGIQKAYA